MKTWQIVLALAMVWVGVLPAGVRAEWNFGGGMEYFTIKMVMDDLEGGFAHSMLQSTLVVSKLNWRQGSWYAEINSGISDWNVSGDFDGSTIQTSQFDIIGWGWQRKTEALFAYQIWHAIGIGARVYDHSLEHYEGLSHYRFTRYRKNGYAVMLDWHAYRTKNVLIQLDAAYAPADRLELSHVVPKDEYEYFCYYETAGVGSTWLGNVRLEYRDSSGWGLDLIYQFSWSEFDHPERLQHVSIKTGSLTGYFVLRF